MEAHLLVICIFMLIVLPWHMVMVVKLQNSQNSNRNRTKKGIIGMYLAYIIVLQKQDVEKGPKQCRHIT